MKVTPMLFHCPGWEIHTAEGTLFQVWGPGRVYQGAEGSFSGHIRTGWKAGWDAKDSQQGDFTSADSLEEVLAIFPEKVRKAFVEAIEATEASK